MTQFDDYIDKCWNDHADNAIDVFNTFESEEIIKMIETCDQIEGYVKLIAHVSGEHLQKWNDGIKLLNNIKIKKEEIISMNSSSDINRLIRNHIYILQLSSGDLSIESVLNSLPELTISEQVSIIASASSALLLIDLIKSKSLYKTSLLLVDQIEDMSKNDPAFRSLAVVSNNLAYTLEELKELLSCDAEELMILAAQCGLKFWTIAGTSLNVQRAHNRLALCYIRVNDLDKAFLHSNIALKLCQENAFSPMDFFNVYYGLSLIERVRSNESEYKRLVAVAEDYFNKMTSQAQSWCKNLMLKLRQ